MIKINSHTGFQKLRTCLVGACYPPEFFSFIKNARMRDIFERIAIETEEDYQIDKFSYSVYYDKILDFLSLGNRQLISFDYIDFYLSKQNPTVAAQLIEYSKNL